MAGPEGESYDKFSNGKSAIVTGASGGIGGRSQTTAKDGFSVVVNYAGKPGPAQAVVRHQGCGGHGITVQADVAIVEDVERLFRVDGTFGTPDVVVHVRHHAVFPIATETWPPFDR